MDTFFLSLSVCLSVCPSVSLYIYFEMNRSLREFGFRVFISIYIYILLLHVFLTFESSSGS